MVMPEDSPGVKVSAVRDTYGAEAGVQSSAKQWPFLIFFGIQDSHLFLEGIQQVPRSCGVFFQVRFCKATQEAREAMSADLVRELREKYGEAKAEEIHPNQEHNCFNAGFRSNKRPMNVMDIHPKVSHQDIRVVNGQGSVGLELLEQEPDLDAIVAQSSAKWGRNSSNSPALKSSKDFKVSIGGGGLIAGVATYVPLTSMTLPVLNVVVKRRCVYFLICPEVKSVKSHIKVIGAEPERAKSVPCLQKT